MFRNSDNVRDAIKFRIQERGIMQKKLAEDLGIAPYRISRYLNDKIPNLSQYQLYKVCDKLDIDVKIVIKLR